ncbi:Radical SAM domain protein (Fe-S oxidoreductase) [Desulfosarcina cetonica]|nr:Radical SAM domain protein (Fe-S oxidoreductase) [Desulfosarcina cetonica]
MKILLIQCPTSHLGAGEKVYPVGLARLSTLVPPKDEKCCLDMNLSPDPWPVLKETVLGFKPQVVALSFRNIDPLAGHQTSYLSSLATTAAMVRRLAPTARILAGGPAFSMFARRLMAEIPEIDAGLVGEGERVFSHLIAANFDPAAIDGLVYRADGEIKQNPEGAAIDLNTLPWPDTTTFAPGAYGGRNAYVAAMGIEGKRGCDLACGYCLYPFLGGRRFRLRAPERIVDEMQRLKEEHGIGLFHFTDPVVNRPKNHFIALCDHLRQRKLDVAWTGFFREDDLDDRTAGLAREAGLAAIYFSADALTEHGLALLQKRMGIEEILAAARVTARHKILTVQHVLVNLPGEDRSAHFEEARANLERLLTIHAPAANLGAVVFNTVRLYPQAPLTRQLIRRGILAADQDLFYPVYYDPPATAHVRHRLEALCHRAMVFDRLGMDRLLAGTAQPTR